MDLVQHAETELWLIGEEPEMIDWYCSVIREFASYGHSGGSASVTIPVLNRLLQHKNLSPLTDDPAEWIDQSGLSSSPLWQNSRNSEAFSYDGGETYYLLPEYRGWRRLFRRKKWHRSKSYIQFVKRTEFSSLNDD
jgi:hypothetical protein